VARLEIKNLTRTFGSDVKAVDGVSLAVEEGEFLTLLGPSGCGKTTLLRLIAGLETPEAGAVQIDGADVTGINPAGRDVAMVFQNYALYPHMRVYDNIAVSLKLRKLGRKEIEQKVAHAAEMLGIEDLLQRLPKELSGGQRQRVALARALVRKPKLFLLDEPLSNLDAVLREKTRAELKMLFARIGGTVIYVTHDQAEAISMSSRVAVMRDGRIQQVGTPEKIYFSPANSFVAGFVGSPSISFIDSEIANGRLIFGQFSVMIEGYRGVQSDRVVAGVRPEDVTLSGEPEAAAAEATVILVEPFGSFSVATIEHEGIRLKATVKPQAVKDGSIVFFRIAPEKIHLFDPATGRVLEKRLDED